MSTAPSSRTQSSAVIEIGFIGAGRMATALARGLVQSGFASADRIVASDVEPAARTAFEEAACGEIVADNAAVVARANVIVL
ncbi:MAG: NAD(P)-binding domain-containing protein, partial [Planctomycetaceae bacterium]|nr:NAD(P)-binding domain-containing protein [Planctomycetaceae bacterium]